MHARLRDGVGRQLWEYEALEERGGVGVGYAPIDEEGDRHHADEQADDGLEIPHAKVPVRHARACICVRAGMHHACMHAHAPAPAHVHVHVHVRMHRKRRYIRNAEHLVGVRWQLCCPPV